jgi:hypothetical protein
MASHAPFDLSAVPQDLRGQKASDVVENVLNPLRIKVAHALFGNSGELPLSSDDLVHTHAITSHLLVTKCLILRLLKNDFLSHLPG